MNTEHNTMESENKEAPLQPQCVEDMDTDKPICVVHLEVKRSEDIDIIERGAPRKDIKSENYTHVQDIKEEPIDEVDVDNDRLLSVTNIKQEELNDHKDIENNVLPDVEDIKQELSEEIDVDIDELKHEVELVSDRFAVKELVQRESESAENIKSMEVKGTSTYAVPGPSCSATSSQKVLGGDSMGAAPSNKCKETHENTQDTTTPTPGGENSMTRLRKRRTVLEEDTSTTNTGSHKFRCTKKAANNKQVLRNITTYSEPTINKGNISVNSDNECTSTNTDVDNSGSEHLTDMLICNDCGNVFDNKCLLMEHIERHDTKRTSNRTSGKESLHQRTALRKQTCSRSGVVNKHTETHSGNNVLECGICHKEFKYKYNLNRHLRTHTGEKPFECKICRVKFTEKGNLKNHVRIHTGEKPFACEICQVKFTRKCILMKHFRIHTGEKPFECEICQVKFTQKGVLQRHFQIHTGEKPFECEICQVKFAKKSYLKIHLRIHTGEKPFKCEICQVKFNKTNALKIHLRIHTGEKPFECEICQVKFNQKVNLNRHLKIHTGEKPFECEICQVKYTEKSALEYHVRVHTGEKPFECQICQAKFTVKSSLNKHIIIHTGEKPFQCEICQVKFTRKDSLKKHYRKHPDE